MSAPDETRRRLGGAVLAGGESRRMGEDKALLLVNGEPLWQRQRRVLAAAGAEPVAIVRRPGQPEVAGDVWHVRDSFENAGPLAGLQAALGAMPEAVGWLAVLAVDMPAVEAAWFHELAALGREGVGAVARHADGFEPLAAIYPREALAVATARLAAGKFSLQGLVAELVEMRRLAVREIADAERWRVANWNSPADRQRDTHR